MEAVASFLDTSMVGGSKPSVTRLASTAPGKGLRAQPQQRRSQATVELLLTIAAELLDDVGIEKFNTNLLADKAGVGPRAIYRYFPNKHAILRVLYETHRKLDEVWIGDLRNLAAHHGWRSNIQRSIDNFYQAALKQRAYVALRQASQVSPELFKLDAHYNARVQGELAIGLRGLGVKVGAKHMNALCRTIIESATRVLDIALQSDRHEAKLLLIELKKMILNLLADYVED